jgi:hypothetical protein
LAFVAFCSEARKPVTTTSSTSSDAASCAGALASCAFAAVEAMAAAIAALNDEIRNRVCLFIDVAPPGTRLDARVCGLTALEIVAGPLVAGW